MSLVGLQNEAESSGLEQPDSMDSLLTKYAFDVECSSAHHRWTERCLVEVRARTVREARRQVALQPR